MGEESCGGGREETPGLRTFYCGSATLGAVSVTRPAGTVLRAPAMLLVTIGWVALLNAANPEAIVARVNLARATDGKAFDAPYHATLPANALPADALPALRAGAPSHCRMHGERARYPTRSNSITIVIGSNTIIP